MFIEFDILNLKLSLLILFPIAIYANTNLPNLFSFSYPLKIKLNLKKRISPNKAHEKYINSNKNINIFSFLSFFFFLLFSLVRFE